MNLDESIGQKKLKRRLKALIRASRRSHYMPSLLFTAAKGLGKTHFAKAVVFSLKRREGNFPRRSRRLNCAGWQDWNTFWEDVMVPHFSNGQEFTLVLDECHAWDKKSTIVQNLLTMLEPNREGRNVFDYDGTELEIDFTRHTFIFCTTESHKIFSPLRDRLLELNLEDYSKAELFTILEKYLPYVDFTEGAKDAIKRYFRGNPRHVLKLGDCIRVFLEYQENEVTFSLDDWNQVVYTHSLLEHGLLDEEFKIMRILREAKTSTVTNLAARLRVDTNAVRDREDHLLYCGYIENNDGKRQLTRAGQKFLEKAEI